MLEVIWWYVVTHYTYVGLRYCIYLKLVYLTVQHLGCMLMVTYVYNRAPVQLRSEFLENGQSSYLELNFVLALQFWPSLFEFQVDQTVGWLSPKGGIGITPGMWRLIL